MDRPKNHIVEASRIVFNSRGYSALGIAGFFVLLTLYAFVLPATYTGGRVGYASLRLITPGLALFALLFSALLALITPFAVYAYRKRRQDQTASSAAGSFFGSILPPLLCCSPILPTVAAFASGAFPFASKLSGFVQGVIATYETPIFTIIVLILAYSLYQNSKQVVHAARGVCTC